MNVGDENRKLVLSILEYLKTTGLPCKVTLFYVRKFSFEEESSQNQNTPRYVRINLNKIPRDIIQGEKEYYIKVKVKPLVYSFHTGESFLSNRMSFDKLIEMLDYFFREKIINHTRKTRLDDILDDTKPITLE